MRTRESPREKADAHRRQTDTSGRWHQKGYGTTSPLDEDLVTWFGVPPNHLAPHARAENSRVAFLQSDTELLAPSLEDGRLDYALFELSVSTIFLRELLSPSLEFFHKLSSHSSLGFEYGRNHPSFLSRGIFRGEPPLAILRLFALSDCSSSFVWFGISPARLR